MSNSDLVSKDLNSNLKAVSEIFNAENNGDLVIRQFDAYWGNPCFLVYLDGMADTKMISDFIIRPLTDPRRQEWKLRKPPSIDQIVQLASVKNTESMNDIVTAVLIGDTVIFQQGDQRAVICEVKGFEKRQVSNPSSEVVIKGSQEAFSESIRTNITLLRRIIKSSQLCTEMVTVGDINKNQCAIVYINGVVSPGILDEVRRRLNNIKGDFLMGSGMIEQMIEDKPLSLFPSIMTTERPERVASYLSDGRIAVICDGSPFVMVMPISVSIFLDSPEEYTARWINGTFQRILRIIALLCTTMLSGVYLALINYHREIIPPQLLSSIVAAQANVPFPTLLEVILMELAFELVREASLRTPGALGGTIGIVGALILGQSAVEANLVSPVTLVVVALSGLSNTAIPDYDLTFGVRIVKLVFIIMGSQLGFLGIAIAILVVMTILANQRSFGVPMLTIQDLRWGNGGPVVAQTPFWWQKSRFRGLHPSKTEKYPEHPRRWSRKKEEK